MIDSGAAGNFTDQALIDKLNISTQPFKKPIQIQVPDGGPISGGSITHHNEPIVLHVSTLYQEHLSFLVTFLTMYQVVFWLPMDAKSKASDLMGRP